MDSLVIMQLVIGLYIFVTVLFCIIIYKFIITW